MKLGTANVSARLGIALVMATAVVAASATISHLEMTRGGLDIKGASLAVYHLARLALVPILAASAYSAGVMFTKIVRLYEPNPSNSLSAFVTTILLGTGLLGIGFVILGAAHLLYAGVGIAIALALCASVPFVSSPPFPDWRRRLTEAVASWDTPMHFLCGLIVTCSVILAANRGLFLAEPDNDPWEHYLHYYDLVLKTHSVWPNDIWYHFYLSKGAGLFFFAGLLGDVFSTQSASLFAMLLLGLVAFAVTTRATGSFRPGLAAAAVLLAALNSWAQVGSIFKHAIMMAALLAGTYYCGCESAVAPSKRSARLFVLTGTLLAFYLAFFTPVFGAIAIAGLVPMMLLTAWCRHSWSSAVPLLIIGVAAITGTATALTTNYLVTGLALDAPTGMFWPIADKFRFARWWNPLVVDYWFVWPALVEATSVGARSFLVDWAWAKTLLRYDYIRSFATVVAAVTVLGSIAGLVGNQRWSEQWRLRPRTVFAALSIAAFLGGTLVVAQPFRGSGSVDRQYAFVIALLVPLLFISAWSALRLRLSEVVASWIVAIVAIFGVLTFLSDIPGHRRQPVIDYALAKASFRDILRYDDRRQADQVTVEQMMTFWSGRRNDRRAVFLTYDASPCYFIPNPVVSEPSYAFGRRYRELLYGGASRTKEILKAEKIGYFVLNLRTRLFLGLPFTDLFADPVISAELGLAWSDGDVYVLGWRDEGVVAPLPERFLAVLRAKRRGSIPAGAEERWGAKLTATLRKTASYRKNGRNFFYLDWLYKIGKAQNNN